jgi:WD40 repeat protein/serine/threonine protein kinase
MSSPQHDLPNDLTERQLAERIEREDDARRTGLVNAAPTGPLGAEAVHRLDQARAGLKLIRQARVQPVNSTLPHIAGYEVQAVLGRGGMGVVYKARHLALNRPVALKLILAGAHAGPEELARFHSESEAVARLDHPNIVRIYEVGQQDAGGGAIPYMALELVEGETLAARLDGRPQPLRASAALVETLARAVDYAHQRGIVHRDLKPANILLQAPSPDLAGLPAGGRRPAEPSVGFPIPKITHFGLAKVLGDAGTHYTATGAVLGTSHYMAPEQAGGRNHEVGPATDIYALGATLYHLLTGRPPFLGELPTDVLLLVLHEEPVSLRHLRAQMPRDLETICLKCLEKDPAKRYPSALALAEDLRRYLDGQPIVARPIGRWGRLWKWARRRPAIAGLTAALALVTLTSIGLVGWQWREAVANAKEAKEKALAEADARREAERTTREVELLLLGADIDRAVTFCERGDMALGMLWLARCLPVAVRLQEADLERVIRVNLAGWRMYYSRQRARLQHDDWAWDVAYSPDGRFVATGSKDRHARLWDALTGRLHGSPLVHPYFVASVAFSPDGKRLLTGGGSDDGMQGDARLWDVATGRLLASLPVGGRVDSAAFSSAGTRILTLARGRAELWKAPAAGAEVEPALALAHPGRVHTALFSPDGKMVLTGGADGTVRLWDAATGQARGEPFAHKGPVMTAAFRQDSHVFAAGVALPDAERKLTGGEIHVWEIDTAKPVAPPLSQGGPPKSVAFSPDGHMLLAGGMVVRKNGGGLTGEARLFDAQFLTPLGPALEFRSPIWVVAFSPDGRTFLTGCEDRQTFQWMTATGVLIAPPVIQNGTVRSVAFSPDGRSFVSGSAGDRPQAQLWLAARGQAIAPPLYHGSPINAMTLSADGQLLITGCDDGAASFWEVPTRKLRQRLKVHEREVLAVSLSPDGGTLASSAADFLVRLWDADTGRRIGALGPHRDVFSCLSFSPDGKSLATGFFDPQVGARRWRVPTLEKLTDFLHPEGVRALAFAPDGRRLLTAGHGGIYHWDADSGELLRQEMIPEDPVRALAISPDGKRFVCGSGWQTAQVWETASGRRLGPSLLHQARVRTAAFSRDGTMILTGSDDKSARVWDAGTGKPLGAPLRHRDIVMGAAFLPGDKIVATASRDQTVQFWELPAPVTEAPERVRAEIEVLTEMELDERGTLRPLTENDQLQRRRSLPAAPR